MARRNTDLTRPKLQRVSVRLPAASEEPVASVLHEVFGVYPSIYCSQQRQTVTASVYLDSAPGLTQLVRTKLVPALKALALRGVEVQCAPRIETIRREDWAESWKKHFPTITLARRLRIQPSWATTPRSFRGEVIVLDPGLSFGTGHHATTRYCLEQLLHLRASTRQQRMLDVGTGSGILAIAGARIGFGPVEAWDFDPVAVRIARANIRANHVTTQVTVWCRDLLHEPVRARSPYWVVCANLTADVLLAGASRLMHRVASGGHLIVAGILRQQYSRVEKMLAAHGLERCCLNKDGEWHSATFQKRA